MLWIICMAIWLFVFSLLVHAILDKSWQAKWQHKLFRASFKRLNSITKYTVFSIQINFECTCVISFRTDQSFEQRFNSLAVWQSKFKAGKSPNNCVEGFNENWGQVCSILCAFLWINSRLDVSIQERVWSDWAWRNRESVPRIFWQKWTWI